MHDDGSMEPDDELAGDDGKDDDMTNVFHSAHVHMHSIPHNPHQMGQPLPGQPPAHHRSSMVQCHALHYECILLSHASLLAMCVCAEQLHSCWCPAAHDIKITAYCSGYSCNGHKLVSSSLPLYGILADALSSG